MKRLFTSIFFMFVVIGALTTAQAAIHTITSEVAVGQGTINPLGAIEVANGGSQTFTFVAANCWEFDRLEVDFQPATPTGPGQYTFTNVQQPHHIRVFFKQLTYTIAASAGANGTITPVGNVTVNCGTNRTFTFAADADFELEELRINGVVRWPTTPPTAAPTFHTFTNVTGDSTIHVTFKETDNPPVMYTVFVTVLPAGENWGTVNPGTDFQVVEGGSQTIQISANPAAAGITYRISSILVNGDPVTINNQLNSPYTFTNVTGDSTIVITFDTTHTSIRYEELPELGVFPNPTDGKLNIVSGDLEISKIEVTNTLGNVVFVIENPTNSFDVSSLAKGTYFLRFTTTRGLAIRQIIRN